LKSENNELLRTNICKEQHHALQLRTQIQTKIVAEAMQHKQLYNDKFRTVIEEDFDDLGVAAAGQPPWPFTSNFGN
jgi:hypothetical protein